MFKNFFSRKKTQTKLTHSKPVALKPPAKKEPEAKTLSQWVESVDAASGKAQTQILTKLVEQVDKGVFNATDVAAALNGVPALMVKLQFDIPVERLTQAELGSLVTTGFTAKVRKYAATEVTEESQLHQLMKETKGKDKAVFRILQESLERQQSERKEHEELTRKRLAVLEGMKKLANAPLEPMYEAKYKGFLEQWREEDASEEQLAEFEQAAQTAKEKISVSLQPEVVEQPQENEFTESQDDVAEIQIEQGESEAVALVESTETDDSRKLLISSLNEKLLSSLSQLAIVESDIEEQQQILTGTQQQWRELDQVNRASKEDQLAFQRVCTAYEIGLPKLQTIIARYGDFQALIDELNSEGRDSDAILHDVDDWLNDMNFVWGNLAPAPIRMLQQALQQYQKTLAEHRQKEIEKVRAIRGQLRRCMSAVEEGSLRRASGLYHGAQEMLADFDLTRHGGVKKQLEETTEALEKLRDWQSFAVLPKKEALIKKMAALIEQPVDPEARSQSIRDMQDEWKLLSRGLQDRQQDLWETFHELAQKAYEPCKEFFSEQRHLRDINLAKRKEVVEQLETYIGMVNWDEPDTKEIDKVLQLARNDWRKYSPVDRVASRQVQNQFDKQHKKLFDLLRKEQEQVKAVKESIINEARTLLELEDIKQATDKAKALQQKWKDVGMIARKEEQKMWQEFRKVCDELFAKREQQVTEFKADLEENRKAAETIIAKLDTLIAAPQPLKEKANFDALKAEYDALGTLPKAQYTQLSADYKSRCAEFEALCKRVSLSAADQHWQAIFDWVRKARFDDVTNEVIMEQWQQIKVPPVAQRLVQGLSDWLQEPSDSNADHLHELTIDLEIMCNVDSPKQDSDKRMRLQVQRLSDGIGGTRTRADIDAVVVDWLATGSVERDEYERLEARMQKARAVGIK